MSAPGTAARPWAPDRYERILAIGAALLLAVALVATARGWSDWPAVPAIIWLHLVTILLALVLTPVMLLRPRGDRRHRQLGYLWVAAMVSTAILSLFVRVIRPGHFSPIHILSAVVLVTVPKLAWSAYRHDVRSHRRSVKIIVTAALLTAGFFTLVPGRLMGDWLLG